MDFLSIDLGTIVFSWINLLILFFGLKHFLFQPVQKILTQRQEETDRAITDAEQASHDADAAKAEYEQQLKTAKESSAEMMRQATRKAQQRSDEIIAQAKVDAQGIREQNQAELERERNRAEQELKQDVSDLAVLVAEKVVEREVRPEDHEKWIDEFIGAMEEQS